MRLWSTVVSQLVTRPCFQVGAMLLLLSATLASLTRRGRETLVRLHVGDESIELPLLPACAHGRHVAVVGRFVLAVQEQLLQAAAVQQGSVALDCRADVAGAVEPMALGAGGSPFL